jgi:DNA-binding NarL/FixJ family response regulator
MSGHARGLRDRLREGEELERLLNEARSGRSGVLVIRGEAGIGKSALLDSLVQRAADFRVAQVAGVESEMELPFAGLHQLVAPMLPLLEGLPAPQQRAVRIALGLASGDAPDRFLVALGALTLLAEMAEQQRLLCIVEDAQWLDKTSLQALGFVARRLHAEPVVIVFALREPNDDPDLAGLPSLTLGGLSDTDARALLATVIPGRLDEGVRDRIVAETRGNPLALLELPRGVSAAHLAGGFGMPELIPLSGRIEESFRRRLDELPPETGMLLLLAAAEPLGEPALMWRAAELLQIPVTALEPAARDGLLEVGTQVRFRHPLVRSAAYRSASDDDRRMVHKTLADATDEELDPDRCVWHRAQAAHGPDDEIADALERSAARAEGRGGLAAAAAFFARSVDLTVDPARRADRALSAAEASYLAGVGDEALRLAAVAESGPLEGPHRARVDALRGRIATMQRRAGDAPPLLLDAARRLERFDHPRVSDTYRDAFIAGIYAGRFADGAGLPEVAAAILVASPADPAGAREELLRAAALLVEAGWAEGAPAAQDALAALQVASTGQEIDLHWLFFACRIAIYVWDVEAWDVLSSRILKSAREAGVLALLPMAAATRVAWELFVGDLDAASVLVEEQDAVQEAIGGERSPGSRIVLAAYRGRVSEVDELDEATTHAATARGDGPWVPLLHWSRALLCNGLGRYDEALAAAQLAAAHPPDLHVSSWALSELVEAAARCGQPDAADAALRRLAEMAATCNSDWVAGVDARARALVAGSAEADQLYAQAIERLGRTPLSTEQARAHLLYGEWLRREGRRVDARGQLRDAHELFGAIGMEAFAERARNELQATGEKARKRTVQTRDELTPQERRIAQMAGDGLSNPEIAAQLFLSPRTVEWHLHKVFAKLEIRSRGELRSALSDAARPAMSA